MNSVNGEEKQLVTVLPIVKDRGAAVIGLTIADKGIPSTAEERLAAAGKIIDRATKMGIPIEDIIIDPLAMTVGQYHEAMYGNQLEDLCLFLFAPDEGCERDR